MSKIGIQIRGTSPILRQGLAQGGRADKKKTLKEKIKSVYKKVEDIAATGALGTGGFRRKKKEKVEADPDETVGGRRIQTTGGPELIPAKRKDDVGVGGWQEPLPKIPTRKFAGGGRADKKWIQKATASIKRRGTKGKCTPITKKGCTGRAKALAKTFKKMAKKRKAT
jgi:hypothetical protein